jgi:plasmid stabilization system protein ParE
MKLRIEVEPQATRQLDELDLWWREHRPDSRVSVLDEFESALEALREQPDLGAPYERGGVRNVRSLRLHDTPYKLYYHHEPGGEVLSVISVWSAMRGSGPPAAER